MPAFRVTGGVLRGTLMSDAQIDNTLPGDQPGIDNSLPGNQPGIDNALPRPPPGVFPPPTISNPIVPIPPGTSVPPGTIYPSPNPPHMDNTLPRPRPPGYIDNAPPGSQPGIDNTLPGSQPGIDNTLPSGPVYPSHPIASNTYWMLCYCPSLGWRYVSVDPSLRPGHDLPGSQPVPTPH